MTLLNDCNYDGDTGKLISITVLLLSDHLLIDLL